MGNYVLRSYDVINLLCFGRWNDQNYSFYVNVTDVVVTGVRVLLPLDC